MKTHSFGGNFFALALTLTLTICSSTRAKTNEAISSFGANQFVTDTNQLELEREDSLSRLATPIATPTFVNAPNAQQQALNTAKVNQLITERRSVPQEITIDDNGAHAAFGAHKVDFDGNLKLPGAIDTVLPNGGRLRSHILGLCYFDPVSGESLMIAEIKDCSGEVVANDTVLYRDAFDGVSADVSYVYTASSLEQNVIIRKRLPAPEKLGFSATTVRLAVLTEFSECVQPRKIGHKIDLSAQSKTLGLQNVNDLEDETLYFGSMRMVEGRAFTLGNDSTSIPVGKQWLELEPGRWFLVESTPYALLKSQLEALSASLTPEQQFKTRKSPDLKVLLRAMTAQAPVKADRKEIKLALGKVDSTPGVVVDYLLSTVPLLNFDFVGSGKYGAAAIGETDSDYWNTYDCPGCTSWSLAGLNWSDLSPSSVDILVGNAPSVGYNTLCLDPMYQGFIYATNNTHLTVTITNLPSDEYDIFVYATRATDVGAPVIELKRAGSSVKTKNLTYWGTGWYSSAWEEGDQYLRFRKVAVTNQTLTLDSYPDAGGYATISGFQIIPSAGLPSEVQTITNLINVNFAAYDTNKVGFAAVGITTNDFWNGYPYGYNYAFTMANLKRADQSTSSIGLTVLNAPGNWGESALSDPMLNCYKYCYNSGDITMTITNLPAGVFSFYLYNHSGFYFGYNTIFELWSGDVPYGIKGTTLKGLGPNTNTWEVGQQYVLFKDVVVSSNNPITIHVKHGPDGYPSISGFQIAYTTNSVDSDADGLPDVWEMKWFNSLDWSSGDDADGDGVSNFVEYQLNLDPTRYDSNGNSINDSLDYEFPWFDDTTPLGAYLYGNSESWSWVNSWHDGTGWGGGTVYPRSGAKMHVSANVANTAHQHYFERSVEVMRPATNDVLYAYINLDPTYPPSEVVLQFSVMESTGSYSWEHRAYWGANNIAWGTDGTASRYNMGPLPGTNQWVRLTVPARLVGVEGKVVEGVACALYSGRAAWDSVGRLRPIDTDGDGTPDYLEDLNGNGILDSGETDPNSATDTGLKVLITSPRNGSTLP